MADTAEELVARCEKLMSHAWMVRTFIKHSEESEDFPELMNIARVIFDTSLALESRANDPAAYFKMLKKKLSKLRKATEQFRIDAAEASTHTNFQQAVVSIETVVEDLETSVAQSKELIAKTLPSD